MRMGLLGALVLLGIAAQAPMQQVRLLRPGTFLIDPPRIDDDERWYALRHTYDGWNLTRAAPRAAAVRPICGDRATQISVDGAPDGVVVLIAGITGAPSLAEGPVVTAMSRARFLYPGESVDISVRPRDGFTIEALGTAIREVGGMVFTNYSLWIRQAQTAQLLASFERRTLDNPTQLIWAGDLDRDLQPDLLFDLPVGDAGDRYVLFLSATAAAKQLVAQVAEFSTPGC